jgi:hypothetical protein
LTISHLRLEKKTKEICLGRFFHLLLWLWGHPQCQDFNGSSLGLQFGPNWCLIVRMCCFINMPRYQRSLAIARRGNSLNFKKSKVPSNLTSKKEPWPNKSQKNAKFCKWFLAPWFFFGLKFKEALVQLRSKWLLLVFHGFRFSSLPMTKHLKEDARRTFHLV